MLLTYNTQTHLAHTFDGWTFMKCEQKKSMLQRMVPGVRDNYVPRSVRYAKVHPEFSFAHASLILKSEKS